MIWSHIAAFAGAAAHDPLAVVLCALAILVAGIVAGYVARRNEEHLAAQARCAPMRTANSSLIDLQTRRVIKEAGAFPHARAGRSPLKPSYDARTCADASSQSPDSPRA